MKIGNLNFKEYAANKPIMVNVAGKYLTAKEVSADSKYDKVSLHTLSNESKVKLTIERYKLEPNFKLGVFNQGVYTKDDILKNVKDQTEFGKLVVQVEMQYCNELVKSLKVANVPTYTKIVVKPSPIIPDWQQIKKYLMIKLKTTALFAENTTDSITGPFATYRIANVHTAFAAKGFNVVVNQGTSDTRTNFANEAKKSLTVYESGIGHGNYDVYTGHAGEIILKVGAYDSLEVKDKAIHFLSCRTASKLGPDTITKGAFCYSGYDENFTFVWDDPSTPVNEVDLFKKCDSTFDIFMANGFTAKQAYDATIAAFNASIAIVPGTSAASWLSYDRDHFRLHGDNTTRLLPYRYVKLLLPLRTPIMEEMLAGIGELD